MNLFKSKAAQARYRKFLNDLGDAWTALCTEEFSAEGLAEYREQRERLINKYKVRRYIERMKQNGPFKGISANKD